VRRELHDVPNDAARTFRRSADQRPGAIRTMTSARHRVSRSPGQVALLACLLVVLAVRVPVARAGGWTVSDASVVVRCPLTIGGSFDARTTALSGAVVGPEGAATALGGELWVDLRTLDTGIGLRTTHMLERYLEVDAKPGFDRAVLSEIEGVIDAGELRDRGTFSAKLTLHGVTRDVSGQAAIRHQGDTLRVEASFPLGLTDFDIPEPRYLGIGVRDEIFVRVTFTAQAMGATRSDRP
jgi:polyisoprenoid-binding protein YceI